MFLGPAILKLTDSLDRACNQLQDISSHSQFKQRTLECLTSLIRNAPQSEFKTLFQMNDIEIFLGYLMSVLCGVIAQENSNSTKKLALETLETLIERLHLLHLNWSSDEPCSLSVIIQGLPGVSSSLFKLIMKDTRLPKSLLAKAIHTLARVVTVSFERCDKHPPPREANSEISLNSKLHGKNLIETCENLSTRIHLMLNYIMVHSEELHADIKHEAINFCSELLGKTHPQLTARTIIAIVRYTAFISQSLDSFVGSSSVDIQLKLLMITDELKFAMTHSDHSDHNYQLESIVLSCLFKVLDNLEENMLTMLLTERQSELAVLCGFMRLLSSEVMTTLMEVSSRKDQLLGILITLTEFSVQQPLLFLTNSNVDSAQAVEVNDGRIYTIEKRFAHLDEKEVLLVSTCCNLLGQSTDWPLLMDILKSDLSKFSTPNNMFVSHQIIKGCLDHPPSTTSSKSLSRFSSQMIHKYREEICRLATIHESEEQNFTGDILMIVIAIETITSLVDLHLKLAEDSSQKVIILKDLLCPLLNWCSSSSRAISEAALTSITQISRLFGHASAKDLIENNLDYILDGVGKMLDNFVCSPEVTNVIAITFKLSSIETFYYFKDIYNRVFKVLARFHYTDKSKTLALLLYRTVTILNDWKGIRELDGPQQETLLALDSETRNATLRALDIDRLMKTLIERTKENDAINERMMQMESTDEDQRDIAKRIQDGGGVDLNEDNEEKTDPIDDQKKRSEEVILTERIIKHCIGLMSSSRQETRILAMKTAANGFKLLELDENTLLPLVHQVWAPLMSRLTQDYMKNLEENLSAFECLVAMAKSSKDFIKRRTLDSILPRLCLFLESQACASLCKKEYAPYCMTMAYKCQLRILSDLGRLAFHTQIAYRNLWRVIQAALLYLHPKQVSSLREAALASLRYLMSLDADCVWFFAKRRGHLADLPFGLIYEAF